MSRRDAEPVCRIYVGNLPSSVLQRDLEREFERFGKLRKCDLKKTVSGAPFAFIEFEDPRDAQDAIKERDGYDYDGSRLRVEIPFNARSGDRGGRGGRGGGRGGRREPPRRGRYVVQISGLPQSGSWQDVKDHMRDAGECGHADVFSDGTGEISFFSRRDAELAIEKFDGSIFRSHEGEKARITVEEKDFGDYSRDGDRAGGGRYRSRSRSYDRRYNDRRRDPSYSRERDRIADKYERRYSTSRSRSRSRRRSYSNDSMDRRRGGGENGCGYNGRRRYSSKSRSRSRDKGTRRSSSRSTSYTRER